MKRRVPIDTYCEKAIAILPKTYNGLIDYIDISSVDNTEKKIVSFQTIDAKDAPSRAKQLLKKGDVIVSTVRPNLNAVAIVENETENLIVGSTGYCVLRCKESLDARYLFSFCQSQYFIDDMSSQATGASYPAVSTSIVKSSLIPWSSIEEQREVAAKLNAVGRLISLRKKQLSKLDELIKSRFIELFGDPVSNSMGLSTEAMTEVCAIIDGDRGKNYPKQDEFSDTGYCLFLNAKNVTATGFSFENCMYITEEKDNALRNGKLERGDVVLTTRGTLGNLAFYDDSVPFENVRINSGMVILRMKKGVVSEVFFIEQFKLQLQSIKEKIASGSAQPQLPISTMNKIRVLLPPMELQEQFAAFVEQTDKSKLAIQKSLDKLETLKKALMQKYFGLGINI